MKNRIKLGRIQYKLDQLVRMNSEFGGLNELSITGFRFDPVHLFNKWKTEISEFLKAYNSSNEIYICNTNTFNLSDANIDLTVICKGKRLSIELKELFYQTTYFSDPKNPICSKKSIRLFGNKDNNLLRFRGQLGGLGLQALADEFGKTILYIDKHTSDRHSKTTYFATGSSLNKNEFSKPAYIFQPR